MAKLREKMKPSLTKACEKVKQEFRQLKLAGQGERGPQLLGRVIRIRRRQDSPNHRHAVRTRLQNLREIRVVDATNSEHRKAHLAYNSGQLLQPLGGAIGDLGGCRKDRAKNDEISAIFGSTAGFLNAMGGDPQELPSA